MKNLIIAFLLLLGGSASAQEEAGVDLISLAGRLMKDGNYIKAEGVLAKLSEDEKETEKYRTIRGLLSLYQEKFEDALIQFDALIDAETKDRYIWIYKGQTLFGLKKYQETINTFSEVQDLAESIPSTFLIRAQSYWSLNQKEEGWRLLREAQNLFPEDFKFPKAQIRWLLELNLFQDVYDYSLEMFRNKNHDLDSFIGIAASLRSRGEAELASKLLEILLLENPKSTSIMIQLALTYLEKEQYFTAANLFEKASHFDQKYAYEAAELHRKAGNYNYALTLNQKILDQKKKFKQKLALLISQGDFEAASVTKNELQRLGLLKGEDIRYALAYALFRIGNYDEVETHLSQIRDPKLFQKASALRKEIAECRETNGCA